MSYSKDDLFGIRAQRTYSGDALKEVAFPLGGIGTGTVSLGGRGQLRDWEIFNRPGKGKGLMYTFPAIFTRTQSGKTFARVLESKLLPPFAVGAGMPPHDVCGLPRLQNAVFKGEYPFAEIEFIEPKLPVKVELVGLNPMIPLNEKDSGIPAAILRYKVKNESSEKVDVTICWSVQNACGNDGMFGPTRRHGNYGQQRNQFVDEGGWRGIKMTQDKHPADDPKFGSMALATTWGDVAYQEAWTISGWWDDCQAFWDDFKADGGFTDNGVHDPSPNDTCHITSLGLKASLAPGESAELPFIIAWHFPNRINYWNREEAVREAKLRNRYGDMWSDAWDVAGYVVSNLARLESESAGFRDALYRSTLPEVVLDAAGANMSIMRTTTGLWLDDDRFHGFEGCSDNSGCCPMNCTHVWNYEQAVAHLYPRLERTMRVTDFVDNIRENGKMDFRTMLPLGRAHHEFHAAADGQMGCILKLYREWLMSGDLDFIKLTYPGAKRSMEYAWSEWDKDQDGVMEGVQHNTYDIEFVGANAMMGTLYLGALKAMEKLAGLVGDDEMAGRCAELYESGRGKHVDKLWNGEFFIQEVDLATAPRYQFGTGCLSDQFLGQWFCEVVGIGRVFPEENVKKTLASIFKYNWKGDLTDHDSIQRTYALNDEAGLLLCTWPKGGRPEYPFTYADEVWTGIEYQVAAHLIYEDMLEEGLSIAMGVRDRHDGIARNPWNEFECGHHYARAMSSWSLILALSGFGCNVSEKYIAFAPKVRQESFKCFFSTGSAWGTYSQQVVGSNLVAKIDVTQGELDLGTIRLGLPQAVSCSQSCASTAGKDLGMSFVKEAGSVTVKLDSPARIKAGEVMEIAIS